MRRQALEIMFLCFAEPFDQLMLLVRSVHRHGVDFRGSNRDPVLNKFSADRLRRDSTRRPSPH
jgi:hypothetical protein